MTLKPARPQPNNILVLTSGIPFSQEAEEAVLGSILVNPDAFVELVSFLKAEDFYLIRNQLIWEALSRLNERNEKIDYVTVQDELRAARRLDDIGGPAYLTQLINGTPTSLHASVYGRIVERASIRRRLLAAADEVKALALDESLPIEKISSDSETKIFDVTARKTTHGVLSVREGLEQYWNRLQENKERAQDGIVGIPTGLEDLDIVIGGLERRKVTLLAGVSGHAKTDTAMNIILNAARLGTRILFFSLDQPTDHIMNKLMSIETGIPHRVINAGQMSPEQWKRYDAADDRLSKYKLWILGKRQAKEPWDTLLAMTKATQYREGLDLVVIDYTTLIHSNGRYPSGSYDDKVFGVNNLSSLAQDYNVHVLGLHQMNKRRITSKLKRPDDMEFLEYGGENAADNVIAMYKEFKYNRKADRRKLEAFILKCRAAEMTVLKFHHQGETAAVLPWHDDPPEEPPPPHWLDELDDRRYGDEE